MKITTRLIIKNWLFCLILFIAFSACNNRSKNEVNNTMLIKIEGTQLTYLLPPPKTNGNISVEKALANRRSQRLFQDKAISADQLSQILWAAYGITKPVTEYKFLRGGFRTSPSAGALYPLEIYAIIGKVEGIEPGAYKYISEDHKIVRVIDKDVRNELSEAAMGQRIVREAPVTIFYSAIFSRTTEKYGERGYRYVFIDLGHSAQNIYLQAEALQLGACAIGSLKDSRVSQILKLPTEEEPLSLMVIGYYNTAGRNIKFSNTYAF
ncbi:MAG: SagB/ThcOx family dehydrogenase [Spirochaetaceae bacterium]|nr:SagB/ThcOx family dehydrogenase [Spirochaetaceae bacterium]